MARIPLLTADSEVEPAVRDVLHDVEEMGLERFMNQFRALAHHPGLAQAFQGVLHAYYFESAVPKQYLELAIRREHKGNNLEECQANYVSRAAQRIRRPPERRSARRRNPCRPGCTRGARPRRATSAN